MQANVSKQCRLSPGLGRRGPQVLRRQVHLVSQDFAIDLVQLLLQTADVGVVAGDGSSQRGGQYHLQAGRTENGSQQHPTDAENSLPDLPGK